MEEFAKQSWMSALMSEPDERPYSSIVDFIQQQADATIRVMTPLVGERYDEKSILGWCMWGDAFKPQMELLPTLDEIREEEARQEHEAQVRRGEEEYMQFH